MAKRIGLHGVLVDATHATAEAFYACYGLQPFPNDWSTMFLPMSVSVASRTLVGSAP